MDHRLESFKTRSGIEFIAKTRLTARQARDIKTIEMRFVSLETEMVPGPDGRLQNKPRLGDYDAQKAQHAKDEAMIDGILTSFDSKTEGLSKLILDEYTSEDYDDVLEVCNKIINPPTSAK